MQGFLFLHKFFHFDKFENVDLKYGNSFSKFHLKNTQLRYFRSQIPTFFVSQETLHLGKFDAIDFTYDNSFFKVQFKNI